MGVGQQLQPKRGLSDWQHTPTCPHAVGAASGEHRQFMKNPWSKLQKNCSGVAQSEGRSPDGSQRHPTYSLPMQIVLDGPAQGRPVHW